MEEKKDRLGILDYMIQPGFLVQENVITAVNEAARACFLSPGMPLKPLLQTGQEEYSSFANGCLYLTLNLSGRTLGASVTRREEGDLFVIEPEQDDQELRAMALAARELREPLSNVMITANDLFPLALQPEDPHARDQAARMNKGLIQMMRILNNMADANRYARTCRQEYLDISTQMAEIFEKAGTVVARAGVVLTYEGLSEPVYCLADREQLERAVLNMLSNAVKFTSKDGQIQAKLVRRGNLLQLSVSNTGAGIEDNIRAHLFHRYLRQLTLEDSRFGIGLGMVLIRCTAANHGGTVLIDQQDGKGTRITMTMAIRQSKEALLRSPLATIDYAGGHDHALLELADCLPLSAFEIEK